MNTLLDLRHNSKRPTHYEELRQLLCMSAVEVLLWAREWTPPESSGTSAGAQTPDPIALPHLTVEVEKFLTRMVNSLKSEAEMWDVVALYHEVVQSGGERGLHEAAKTALAGEAVSREGQTESAPTAAEMWLRGRSEAAYRDCRTKQVRALLIPPLPLLHAHTCARISCHVMWYGVLCWCSCEASSRSTTGRRCQPR